MVTSTSSTSSLLYLHSALKLTDLSCRGHGYIASKHIKKGELLIEERPFVWDSGQDPHRPDLSSGIEWLLKTGAVNELPCPAQEFATPQRRAETVASLCSFRIQSPCADGNYPAMLFRASSRFNHSCFPNAGGYVPGGLDFPTVAAFKPHSYCTFAIEDIKKGEEVCICYLSDADQLSPAGSRQANLQLWGFTCQCHRCKGGRPLDRRLEGLNWDDLDSDFNQVTSVARANREYRSLFDPTYEEYDPPKDDFQATVDRLNQFREKNKFLDKANMVMQRVRKELIAALLIDGEDGEIGKRFAGPAASLLIEEMQIQNEMLPGLSPCKVRMYARFMRVLKHVPPEEATWLRREVKHDGCELMHLNALWLHNPNEAKSLGVATSRNLPPRPAPGPPPRTGPEPQPGACCSPVLKVTVPTEWCASVRGCRTRQRRRWHCRRHVTLESPAEEDDELPQLIEPPKMENEELAPLEEGTDESNLMNLWEAYGEYGGPSSLARSLGGAGAAAHKKKSGTWFKFK